MKTQIKIPAVGESITEATIAEWTKNSGDAVQRDEIILVLETDKASVEVVAETSGVLTTSVAAGETVNIGTTVGEIDEAATSTAQPTTATTSSSSPTASAPAGPPLDVTIPAVGESITEATIAEWSHPNGSVVQRDDVILVLETDKASVEVVAEATGVLSTLANEGDTLAIGSVVGSITPTAASASPPASAETTSSSAPATATNTTLSPAVQRVVAENKLDPNQISGSGKHGQITKADALNATSRPAATPVVVKQAKPIATPQLPQTSISIAPAETRQPMSRLRQTIARRLVEAQHTAAILTTFNEIDMTAIMDLRKKYKEGFLKKHDVKLGFMGFFMRASIEALKDFPLVNSSIEGTEILSRNFINMGIAVGTPKGLVVPVIKNAETLSLADLEKSIVYYATKARDGKISMDDLSGGTFTISNGGTYGSLLSTPILNPPQSGILGLHKIEERPIALNGQVVIRPMMYVALSYDHRIIDGSESVKFLVKIKECMEDPARMLLDI